MTVGSSDYLGDKDSARLTILLWHETPGSSSQLSQFSQHFPGPEEEVEGGRGERDGGGGDGGGGRGGGGIKLRVTLFVVTPAPRKNRHYPA